MSGEVWRKTYLREGPSAFSPDVVCSPCMLLRGLVYEIEWRKTKSMA